MDNFFFHMYVQIGISMSFLNHVYEDVYKRIFIRTYIVHTVVLRNTHTYSSYTLIVR